MAFGLGAKVGEKLTEEDRLSCRVALKVADLGQGYVLDSEQGPGGQQPGLGPREAAGGQCVCSLEAGRRAAGLSPSHGPPAVLLFVLITASWKYNSHSVKVSLFKWGISDCERIQLAAITIEFRMYSSPQKETSCPLAATPYSPHSQASATTNLPVYECASL